MALSFKHATQAVGADAGNGEIRKAQWNEEHTLTIDGARLIGRSAAGNGAAGEIAIGRGLRLEDGNLSSTGMTYYSSSLYIIPGCISTTTSAISSNRLHFIPVMIYQPGSVNRIGFEVTTGVAGSAVVGLYSTLNGLPNTLLVQTGVLDTASPAIKEGAVTDTALTPGLYWMALLVSVNGLSVRAAVSQSSMFGVTGALASSSGAFSYVPEVTDYTYTATLPSTAPAPTGSYLHATLCFMRKV